jgi:glycosyltransferase involved in cell wall biosynthesis
MKVALVYDRVNKWGGAERVLLALHRLFPDAPLYTSVYHQKKASWADTLSVRNSFLQHFPKAASIHELYALFMPIAFESFSFDTYDVVITVTSEAAKGIITKPHTKHICYCLTPTRYLWSGYDEYFENKLFRFLATPGVSYLQKWDLIAANRPDRYITISEESKARIRKYYKQDADVIYPPVTLGSGKQLEKHAGEEFFLVVSRLVPYKRIDIAVKACTQLKLPLKVVGEGSEIARLRSIAGPTVEFLGKLTDEQLIEYYKNCIALLFPGREDFGIVIVEAQQFGKPAIALNDGGARETVIHGKTGILFDGQSVKSMKEAILQFQSMRFDRELCRHNAEKFGFDAFKEQFLEALKY